MNNYKIGVGICACNRYQGLTTCYQACMKYNKPEFDIFIAIDSEPRIGIARNKNRILNHFQHYDIVVILEDDSIPKHPDWLMAHIKAYEATGCNHFCYPTGVSPDSPEGVRGKIYERIDNPVGVDILVHQHADANFYFLTHKVLEICGGHDIRFDTYGVEHMEYSTRIATADLCFGNPGYPSLENVTELIGDQGLEPVLSKEVRKASSKANRILWDGIDYSKEGLYREFR